MSYLHNTLSTKDEYITTLDNRPAKITLHISSWEELEEVDFKSFEVHGIGLLDTDFLYKNRTDLPGEEEQYLFFKDIASKMPDKPINIRTCALCSGELPTINAPTWEINPDLGLKGLRLGLEKKGVLKTQLRAILRANAHGQLRVLLPMVSSPREITRFKEVLYETGEELKEQDKECHVVKELGIMVDLPSAVISAAQLSFSVSFFQVGSTLKNYTLGIDFAEQGLSYLKNDFEPAFLQQLLRLSETANQRKKIVGVSSPLASLCEGIPILLAIGVQEFIIKPNCVQQVKHVIQNINFNKSRALASKAMSYWTGKEVQEYAQKKVEKLGWM
ncbi:MAG: hypothetical protein K9L17_12780 [Clostridiales bacterium]|nr:hypothetical protein [Clostridiales bacterium]MCF8023554.1 hypothetical protein [Clostridiales bacterium]